MSEWEEFEDSAISKALVSTLILAFFIVLLWFMVNVEEQRATITIYLFITIIVAILWFSDYITDKLGAEEVVSAVGFGNSLPIVLIASAIGIFIGYFLVFGKMSIAVPLSVGIPIEFFRFLYIVIASPVLEELLFRATLIPTLIVLLNKTPIAQLSMPVSIIGSAGAFAFFHFSVFGGSTQLIFSAFVFGLIAGIVMIMFKTIAGSILMHGTNNYLVYNLAMQSFSAVS